MVNISKNKIVTKCKEPCKKISYMAAVLGTSRIPPHFVPTVQIQFEQNIEETVSEYLVSGLDVLIDLGGALGLWLGLGMLQLSEIIFDFINKKT